MDGKYGNHRREFRIFVGGPIQHALHARGEFDLSLRVAICGVIDALKNFGYTIYSAHLTERFGELTADLDSHSIAVRDMQWMRSCDLFIAVLPLTAAGEPYRTDGTFIEVGWASALAVPILLLTTGSPPCEAYSHLVRGLGAVAFAKVLDLKTALEDKGGFSSQVISMLEERSLPIPTQNAKHTVSDIRGTGGA